MHQIHLPADVSAQLGRSGYPAELCDETGAVKAVALPVDLYQEMFDLWADAAFDPEALERARSETGGYTTAEAVAHLQKVAEGCRRP